MGVKRGQMGSQSPIILISHGPKSNGPKVPWSYGPNWLWSLNPMVQKLASPTIPGSRTKATLLVTKLKHGIVHNWSIRVQNYIGIKICDEWMVLVFHVLVFHSQINFCKLLPKYMAYNM